MRASSAKQAKAERRARLLLFSAEAEQAGPLVQRLPSATYDVISSPLAALDERWIEELGADLVLLLPPTDQKLLLEACEAVRARVEAPVVVLSERGEELLVTRALAAGIDEYLVLPIGDRELTARIAAMLRWLNRTSSRADSRQVGGLVLSAADQSVTRNERRVFLSPIEFRLLAALASSPGRVLTHQTLMSRVWGAEYVDARHYLRVYIRYLREKLEDDPNNPQLILSEWGVGYRLQIAESTASPATPAAETSGSRRSR